MIRRGTTPTVRINVNDDIDLTAYTWHLIIWDEDGAKIGIDDQSRITVGTGYVETTLQTAETLKLNGPRCYLQLMATDLSGNPVTSTGFMVTVVGDSLEDK